MNRLIQSFNLCI